MACRTKIIIQDAYEITDIARNDNAPYISDVRSYENTSNKQQFSFGGTAANSLELTINNSPIQNLDGLKIMLFAKEIDETVSSDLVDTIPMHVDAETTLADITDEENPEEHSSIEMGEEERQHFLDEYNLVYVEDIDTAPDAEALFLDDDVVIFASSHTEGTNDEYRTDSVVPIQTSSEIPCAVNNDDWVPKGVYWVKSSPRTSETRITLKAYDSFVLMTGKLETTLTASPDYLYHSVLNDVVTNLGLPEVIQADLPTEEITIPAGTSYRELAGIVASYLGAYARFNEVGELELRQYLKTNQYSIPAIDIIDTALNVGGIRIDSVATCSGAEYIILPADAEVSSQTAVCNNRYMDANSLETILPIYKDLLYVPGKIRCRYNLNIKTGDIVHVTDLNRDCWLCCSNIVIDWGNAECVIESKGDTETGSGYTAPNERFSRAIEQSTNKAREVAELAQASVDDAFADISAANEKIDEVSDTCDGLTVAAQRIEQRVSLQESSLNNKMDANLVKGGVTKGQVEWVDADNSLHIKGLSADGQCYETVIGGDGIKFLYGSEEKRDVVASVNQDNLIINKTIVYTASRIGNWIWEAESNGNLCLKYGGA